MNSFLLRLALFLLASGVLSAKPIVVTSNTILADFVRVIGGSDVAASCLLGAGADPHGFEPRPSDVRTLAKADLLIVNGLGYEKWLEKIVRNSGFRGAVVEAASSVTPLVREDDHAHHSGAGDAHAHHHHHDEVDPHAWHDLRNASLYAEVICAALARTVPEKSEAFRERTAAFRAELAQLHAETVKRLQALPSHRRKLVTSHDALHYFATAYGLTVVPVRGLQTDREPGAKQLAALVQLIRNEKVPAVFIESTSNPKLLKLLANDAGVTVVRELYTDSLGPAGSPGETFLGMFKANVDTIADALK